LQRRDGWRKSLDASRRVINYINYLRLGHQSSQMILEQYEAALPHLLRSRAQHPAISALLRTPVALQALRRFERLAPPDPAITRWLRAWRPDVVLASPVIMPGTDEVEFLKAAAALRVPTIVPVMSWDNLTSYGVFQILPDMTIVWNKAQVEEAVRLHGVPRDRVVATGAPVFDEWFTLRPTLTRDAFGQQVGLDPAQPFVLYMCSAWSIAQDETTFVKEVALGLRRRPATHHVNVLVRPHPSNARIWQHYADDTFTVWPREDTRLSTTRIRQDFFHSLHFSAAALGINTTGFIEAAIADRPCLTILAERYRDTQQNFAHFQHLLNGDFLEVAPSAAAAADMVAAIVDGQDGKQERRRRFAQDFVRPWGLDQPASPIMAQAIEAVARRHSLKELTALLATQRDPAATAAPRPAANVTAMNRLPEINV
jgi:hypothetical protein